MVTLNLTDNEAKDLHAALMQLPNASGTYPVLLKLVEAVNAPESTEDDA